MSAYKLSRNQERQELLLQALRSISADCDHANAKDGKGFNMLDASVGNKLAKLSVLNPPQILKAEKLVKKYRKQVPQEILDRLYSEDAGQESVGSGLDISLEGEDIRVTTNMLADAITAEEHFAKDPSGALFIYAGGVYMPNGDRDIRRAVKRLFKEWGVPDKWGTKGSREVVEYIRTDAPELLTEPPSEIVNLKNGLLNLVTRELKPHSPDFLFPVQFPVEYDPQARCPEWEKFVEQTFPEDAQGLGWQIPAFLLGCPSIQKAVLLYGEGGNGKSTYLSALTALVGKENVSTLSLQQLESNRFATARLLGKVANICPDLPAKRLENTGIFKAITGGDEIPAERKFRDGFDFRPFARLIFSANQLPLSSDATQGYFDRWLIVPFERSFRGTSQEVSRDVLDARLADTKELSGVLNKALDALDQLRKTGRFSEPECVRIALQEYRSLNDPVETFLRRRIEDDPTGEIPVKELRHAYNDDAERHGRAPISAQQFGNAILRLRPQLDKVRRSINGDRPRVYRGIAWKERGAA